MTALGRVRSRAEGQAMAVKIRFTDGVELVVGVDPDDLRTALEGALANSHLLEIDGPNGKAWTVNPNQVVYVEEVDDLMPAARKNGAGRAHRPAKAR